jgi:hypothetical protein
MEAFMERINPAGVSKMGRPCPCELILDMPHLILLTVLRFLREAEY